jgi:hypothetical protein
VEKKLQSAILNKEQLDVETIKRDDCCELGKWLYGKGDRYSIFSKYSICIEKHKELHIEAAKIAETINAEKYTEAKLMTEDGGFFSQLITSLCISLMLLKQEGNITD